MIVGRCIAPSIADVALDSGIAKTTLHSCQVSTLPTNHRKGIALHPLYTIVDEMPFPRLLHIFLPLPIIPEQEHAMRAWEIILDPMSW